jgi:hypothetical protein
MSFVTGLASWFTASSCWEKNASYGLWLLGLVLMIIKNPGLKLNEYPTKATVLLFTSQ